MSMLFPGWAVAREIPPDVILGLITKRYTQHGGVIRWAAGTENAGQIVRHLIPIGQSSFSSPTLSVPPNSIGLLNAYQLAHMSGQLTSLSTMTQQVLQIATTTMLLSGLNLMVSAVGFAVLHQQLTQIERKLEEIKVDVRAIRDLLERQERAKLRAALHTLSQISQIERTDTHEQLVISVRTNLAELAFQYIELMQKAETPEIAMAYEEYFCLSALAYVRCYTELGAMPVAQQALSEMVVFWRAQTRRIANDLLLGNDPQRYLFSDFVQEAPVTTIIDWIDFARDQSKGYTWIDELRATMPPWYRDRSPSIKVRLYSSHEEQRIHEKTIIIPALQHLVARNNVLDGYIVQAELMEAQNMVPSQLEHEIAALSETAAVNGYLILEPMMPLSTT